MLLLHYTGMESADGALSWLCNTDSEVSAHYFVFEDGRIIQMVPEGMRAWHAGKSIWAGDRDINSCSIGIEIANPGHACGSPEFPDLQMDAVVDLCRDIVSRHNIPASRVLAHSDVAPGRKQDPGEKFDWQRLAAAGIGLWPDIKKSLGEGKLPQTFWDTSQAVLDMQEKLARFGYEIAATGALDRQTKMIVEAFHLHFRPKRTDQPFDAASMAMLDLLLADICAI
ncbi:MAG: N-acetylmuramoyl-L-alanine amidase [Rhizobiales bacterium]|nr:N-acetylmuramoyl-L-alanine amidase [Hyphomicrobiales bacterium]